VHVRSDDISGMIDHSLDKGLYSNDCIVIICISICTSSSTTTEICKCDSHQRWGVLYYDEILQIHCFLKGTPASSNNKN